MLRLVCERELAVVPGDCVGAGRRTPERIGACVAVFTERALRGEGLAYAVIVEPMDPDVDQIRLDARGRLAGEFAGLIEQGVAAGELPEQDARLGGAAIVGAFLEGVVAPLAGRGEVLPDRVAVASELARFCQAAVGGTREHGAVPAEAERRLPGAAAGTGEP